LGFFIDGCRFIALVFINGVVMVPSHDKELTGRPN